MSNEISIAQYKSLVKSGKVGKKKGSDKAKNEFFGKLQYWCNVNGFKWEMEYRFIEARKFRFDMLIHLTDKDVAVEWNGVIGDKSRHLTLPGYSKDLEKINLAQINGYVVLQVTVMNSQKIYEWLEMLLQK